MTSLARPQKRMPSDIIDDGYEKIKHDVGLQIIDGAG